MERPISGASAFDKTDRLGEGQLVLWGRAVHISEGVKKAGLFGKDYAAIISMPMIDEASFIPELREMRHALMDWKKARGGSAKTVIITLSGSSSGNEWAEAMLVAVFEDDPELNSIAKKSDVQVSILNRGRTPSRQFAIAG